MLKCLIPCKHIFYCAWETRDICNTTVCHRMQSHVIESYGRLCHHEILFLPFPFQTGNMGHKRPILTFCQHQVARHITQQKRCVINADVNSIIEHIDREAKHLSIKHTCSLAWFRHLFYQGGHCQGLSPPVPTNVHWGPPNPIQSEAPPPSQINPIAWAYIISWSSPSIRTLLLVIS